MHIPEGTKRATSVIRATSVPAEGPANRLDFERHCEFPLRALQAQKWYVHERACPRAALEITGQETGERKRLTRKGRSWEAFGQFRGLPKALPIFRKGG